MTPTGDLRVTGVRPLLPAAILIEEIPLTEQAAGLVRRTRNDIEHALAGQDPRLVLIIGPCSVHDPVAVLDYAAQLKELIQPYENKFIVGLRTYFEKPRTTVGWKGLINDPYIDGSFQINVGLRLARRLLADCCELGLAPTTEFLDTSVPQHIADLIAWGAIGARTSESQTHRELASGLSMPVGFKNATDGNVQIAIDAIQAAARPHWFPGTTKDGVNAIIQTAGNPTCHVVLRGGSRTGPNYGAEHVAKASTALSAAGVPSRVMIDLSHANSAKDHNRQLEVAADVAQQLRTGESPIFGVMVESFLVPGRQDYGPGATYGQSITDACIGIAQTREVLDTLASALP